MPPLFARCGARWQNDSIRPPSGVRPRPSRASYFDGYYGSPSTQCRCGRPRAGLPGAPGALPAVVFQADAVAAVRGILAETGICWRADSLGNLIARIPGISADADSVPPIASMAHMDHPGLEVNGWDGDYLVGRPAGGTPPGTFAPGVPRQIILPDGRRIAVATAGPYDAAGGGAAPGATPAIRAFRATRAPVIRGR